VHRTWRNGLGGLAAALLLAAGGLVGSTTAATAAPPVTTAATSFLKIVNNSTGKCIDVPASSHATGTLLQLWPCHGGDNQRWTPIDTGDGFFQLQSKNTPSMCMNVQIADLWPVDQQSCVAWAGQKWRWAVVDSNGDLVLVSALPQAPGEGSACLRLNNATATTRLAAFACDNITSAMFWHPES
jgi:hypothetical protein